MKTRSDFKLGSRSIAAGFIALIAFTTPGSAETAQDGVTSTPLRVVDSVEVDMGPRSIFYNRVETPLLKPQPQPTPVSRGPVVETEPTAEELAEIAAWNAKADYTLFLSCTVYDGKVTEVRWQREDGEYLIWSGMDFNHLRMGPFWETDRARLFLMLGIGDESSKDSGAVIPKVPAGEYRIVGFPKTGIAPEAIAAMNELHALYNQHREEFRQAFEAFEAKRLEDEAWARAHPPVPKDTVINYFPIRSVYTDKALEGASR